MMKYPIAWLTFYSQVFIQFLKGVCLSALAAVLFGVFFLICVNQRESVATLKDIHRTVLIIGGAAGDGVRRSPASHHHAAVNSLTHL